MSQSLPPAGPSPAEDGRSPVAGAPRRELSTGSKLGFLALMGVVILCFIWFNALFNHRKADSRTQAGTGLYASGGEDFNAPPATPIKMQPPIPMPQPAGPAPSFVGGGPRETPASAPIMAFSGGGNEMPALPAALAQTGGGPEGGGAVGPVASQPDTTPLAARLKPTVLDGEKASVIANPDLVITEGTIIPCTLQTAIDTQLPGLVTCVVPIDIRGTTGNVVLLDAGTKIVGQIQSGLLQGQNRVFVDWTRAETPEHVIVTLDSPGADELGRAGLAGAVDNHFWQRFGGALMMTLVQGALDAATVTAAGSGDNNSTSGQAALGFVYAAQSNGQTIANTALQNSINIPPTLTKNQAETVALFVAHDLDFSGVYKLQVNNLSTAGGGNGW